MSITSQLRSLGPVAVGAAAPRTFQTLSVLRKMRSHG